MREISYPRKWRWPGGQKLAMSVGLALEAFERHSQFSTQTSAAARPKVNHFSLSYADYGWKAGVWRLLELLGRYALKANMSTSVLVAERHPNVVAAVSDSCCATRRATVLFAPPGATPTMMRTGRDG
jgi:hypothetical protein